MSRFRSRDEMRAVLVSRVTKTKSGCWLWTGAKSSKGYGQIRWMGKTHQAHRLAWELAKDEPMPAGLVGMHVCDTPACINPSHITPGTPVENAQDCVRKGRHGALRGESSPLHKLTDDDVRSIVRRVGIGTGYAVLAKEFGVSLGLIGHIMGGYCWNHVTGFPRRDDTGGARKRAA